MRFGKNGEQSVNTSIEMWAAHGEPIIRVTHSLQAMLTMTKCGPDRIRFPFDQVYISLAEPIALLGRSEPATARGLFLCRDDRGSSLLVLAEDPSFESGYYFWQPRDVAIERIARNLAAYINTLGGIQNDSRTQQNKHGRSRKGAKSRPDYTLGREIKLSPQLRALASADGPARYRFKSKWLVRGHFRQQPIGEGGKGRKTIWIHPFWKGPVDGPVLVPRYVVGEETVGAAGEVEA